MKLRIIAKDSAKVSCDLMGFVCVTAEIDDHEVLMLSRSLKEEAERIEAEKEPGSFIVELLLGVWLSVENGEPIAVMHKEKAEIFPTRKKARDCLELARSKQVFQDAQTINIQRTCGDCNGSGEQRPSRPYGCDVVTCETCQGTGTMFSDDFFQHKVEGERARFIVELFPGCWLMLNREDGTVEPCNVQARASRFKTKAFARQCLKAINESKTYGEAKIIDLSEEGVEG